MEGLSDTEFTTLPIYELSDSIVEFNPLEQSNPDIRQFVNSSMPERLTVAAVIAHHRRLNDAGALGIGARRDGEREVRGVMREVRGVQWVQKVRGFSHAGTLHPRNGVTDERAKFLVGHS